MRIDIIAVVPELLSGPLSHSILQRAQDKGLLSVHIHDLRNFGIGNYRQIDDYQYGGGAGMVLKPEPLANCLQELIDKRDYDEIIYLTPDGDLFKQKTANKLSLLNNICLICGHYKGIDQRIRDIFVTMELSIGDYVLSGGELGAAVVTDAIGRLIPGVLNDECSALTDSFQDNLLAPPTYTRPREFQGLQVPEILLSGNDKKIEDWRYEQSLLRTKTRRPDLLSDEESEVS